jgi:hypothetical protein
MTAVYSQAGQYLATGWVQDDDGAYNVAQTLITARAYRFHTPVTADNYQSALEHASLAIINGHPAIAYHDDVARDLRYVRAGDTSGTTWGTPIIIESTNFVGEYASLTTVDGHPAIAYYDSTNGDLKYIRAEDASGSTWPLPGNTVDSAANVGLYASLAIVEGRPAIAYYDSSYNDLRYIRANDATGISWPSGLDPVDGPDAVGRYASLAVVNGRPSIAYRDDDHTALKYTRADDALGASWTFSVTVDNAANVGEHASLAVVDGHPAIAYYDSTNDDLKYVRAEDASGTTWGTPLILDSPGDVGEYASLAVVDGRPAVAYYDATNLDLKYIHARDAVGETWGPSLVLSSDGEVGESVSLTEIDGRPAIAYYDDTNWDMRFIIPYWE